MMSEINSRFNENDKILLALSPISDAALNNFEPLKEIGIDIPSATELEVAQQFLRKKFNEMANTNDNAEVSELAMLHPLREGFESTYKLLLALETFGCSTATCEASFSCLSRIDQLKRMSMTDNRLVNLAYSAFEKEQLKKVSVEDILIKFNDAKNRKVQLF